MFTYLNFRLRKNWAFYWKFWYQVFPWKMFDEWNGAHELRCQNIWLLAKCRRSRNSKKSSEKHFARNTRICWIQCFQSWLCLSFRFRSPSSEKKAPNWSIQQQLLDALQPCNVSKHPRVRQLHFSRPLRQNNPNKHLGSRFSFDLQRGGQLSRIC